MNPTCLSLKDFDYSLPKRLIAQFPAAKRDASRLLIFTRSSGSISHKSFSDLPDLLLPTDTLVINDSRVIPARLRGRKADSGGAVELLLLKEDSPKHWWVMLKPARRVRKGMRIFLDQRDGNPSNISFQILEKNDEGHCLVSFESVPDLFEILDDFGEMPIPPYIDSANREKDHDRNDHYDHHDRYQTIYARSKGSIAAPTAGLHFSKKLLASIRKKGIEIVEITLHIGLGTFSPIKANMLSDHKMHVEDFIISSEAARKLNEARSRKSRIIAVGTSTLRVLETAFSRGSKGIHAQQGSTQLFIRPPFCFGFTDALITNFHLPRSTLLMLVSAMASPGRLEGIEDVRRIYAQAIQQRYRFFSYGDAMLIQ